MRTVTPPPGTTPLIFSLADLGLPTAVALTVHGPVGSGTAMKTSPYDAPAGHGVFVIELWCCALVAVICNSVTPTFASSQFTWKPLLMPPVMLALSRRQV